MWALFHHPGFAPITGLTCDPFQLSPLASPLSVGIKHILHPHCSHCPAGYCTDSGIAEPSQKAFWNIPAPLNQSTASPHLCPVFAKLSFWAASGYGGPGPFQGKSSLLGRISCSALSNIYSSRRGNHTGFSCVTILSPTIYCLHWKHHSPVEEHLCKFRMFIGSPGGEDVEPNPHVPENAARNPPLLTQTTFFLWRHNNAWHLLQSTSYMIT